MDIGSAVWGNLFSPPILFFALGMLTSLMRVNLTIPKEVSKVITLYLIIAIGFKGGLSFLSGSMLSLKVLTLFVLAVGFGLLQPLIGFTLLKKTSKLSTPDSASIAAHYGSISLVTFVTALSFLNAKQIPFDDYMISLLAIMEAPAIMSGLYLAKKYKEGADVTAIDYKKVVFNDTILLLLGSFIIGAVCGVPGKEVMAPVLITPFQGMLAFFLLDMGLKVGKEAATVKGLNIPLLAFSIYMPIIGACVALLTSLLLGLSLGTGMLLITLFASASYIAVPAAMRLALPEASPALALPMSLAITFPFNIIIGIPLYYYLASLLLA